MILTANSLVPLDMRCSYLALIALIIDSHPANQQHLLTCSVPDSSSASSSSSSSINALTHLLRLCLYSQNKYENILCEYVVKKWLYQNKPGQLALASSCLPGANSDPSLSATGGTASGSQRGGHSNESKLKNDLRVREQGTAGAGSTILQAFSAAFSRQTTAITTTTGSENTSTRIITQMMSENLDVKLLLLTLPLEESTTSASIGQNSPIPPYFINTFLNILLNISKKNENGSNHHVQGRGSDYNGTGTEVHACLEINLLILLCIWMDKNPHIIDKLFMDQELLTYLITLINSNNQLNNNSKLHIHKSGLAAFVLAFCLHLTVPSSSSSNPNHPDNPDKDSSTSPAADQSSSCMPASRLLDVITSQISLDRFKGNMERLVHSEEFHWCASLSTTSQASVSHMLGFLSNNPLHSTPTPSPSANNSNKPDSKERSVSGPSSVRVPYYSSEFTVLLQQVLGMSLYICMDIICPMSY